MKNLKNTRNTFTGLLLTALIGGCGWNHGEKFEGDSAPTALGRVNQAQSASGAAQDAMLYDMHFHGAELNSLGQGKLDLMTRGTHSGDTMTIFMNMPHDTIASRQTAVTAYLKTHGVVEDRIIVAEGSNPNSVTPTAYNLSGLYKADGGTYNGQAAAEQSSGGIAGAASGAGH